MLTVTFTTLPNAYLETAQFHTHNINKTIVNKNITTSIHVINTAAFYEHHVINVNSYNKISQYIISLATVVDELLC